MAPALQAVDVVGANNTGGADGARPAAP